MQHTQNYLPQEFLHACRMQYCTTCAQCDVLCNQLVLLLSAVQPAASTAHHTPSDPHAVLERYCLWCDVPCPFVSRSRCAGSVPKELQGSAIQPSIHDMRLVHATH